MKEKKGGTESKEKMKGSNTKSRKVKKTFNKKSE